MPLIITPRRTIIIGRTTRTRIGHRLYTLIPAGSIFTRISTLISASVAVVIPIMADAGTDQTGVLQTTLQKLEAGSVRTLC
jgi:hypothetical protein